MNLNSAPGNNTASQESESAEFEKLSAFLIANKNKKVILTYSAHTNRYGLSLSDFSGDLISESQMSGDEMSTILTGLLRKYHAQNPVKYKEPEMNPKTMATTPETIQAASFTVRDLLEDLKMMLEAKA